ncbi:MAG: cation diffusion facilitator family transporter, partial [Methanomassiliicoccales archaeon]
MWQLKLKMNKRKAALLAVFGGLTVFTIKMLAYVISDSVALLSDALESIINVLASVMMFFSITIAQLKEDSEHQYGHQKAENISALLEGLLIIIAAVVIAEASLNRILRPVELYNLDLALAISLTAT